MVRPLGEERQSMTLRRPSDGPPGKGGLTWPRGHAPAEARATFLRIVQEMVPDVVSSLWRDVLPSFERLKIERGSAISDATAGRLEALREDPLTLLRRRTEGAASAPPFFEALKSWATRWNLDAPWLHRFVLTTLDWWAVRTPHGWQRTDQAPTAWPSDYGELLYSPTLPPPHLRAWQPAEEKWSEYRRYAQEALKQYRDNVEGVARAHGMVPWPERRARRKSPDQHLEWLVRFQVLEQNQEALAESEGVDRRTLQSGIKNVRDLIGLKPRKGRTRSRTRRRK